MNSRQFHDPRTKGFYAIINKLQKKNNSMTLVNLNITLEKQVYLKVQWTQTH